MSDCNPCGTTTTKKSIAARVYSTEAQVIPDATETAVIFDTARFDTDHMFSPTVDPTRLTIKTAGKYQISGMVQFAVADASAAGTRSVSIRLNGTTVIAKQLSAGTAAMQWAASLSTLYLLAVGDYLELVVRQVTGDDLLLDAASNFSPELAAVRVGGTSTR